MTNKTFSIDLDALNDYLDGNYTEWGYYIEIEDDGYYDLRGAAGLYACDGEVCEVIGEHDNFVVVHNIEHDLCGNFKFSKEEFTIIAH